MSECTLSNEFLATQSIFGGLSDADLTIVRPLLDERHYPKGTVILRQGEPNNSVYFIVEGDVLIQKHSENGGLIEREIATLHAGDSFGEMELIDIQGCAASAICLTDVCAVMLTGHDLYRLSKSHLMLFTMIIMNLARDISRRLRKTDNLLAMITKQEPSE